MVLFIDTDGFKLLYSIRQWSIDMHRAARRRVTPKLTKINPRCNATRIVTELDAEESIERFISGAVANGYEIYSSNNGLYVAAATKKEAAQVLAQTRTSLNCVSSNNKIVRISAATAIVQILAEVGSII